MKPRKPFTRAASPLLVAAIAALVIGTALPAFAATTGATFELTGGSLSLAVQPTAALTVVAAGATTITGSLGLVTVTDNRGGTEAWTVTVASSTFTGAHAGATSAATSTNVQYTAGAVDTSISTGSITVAAGPQTVITASASVVAPTAVSGNNIATWTPALAVTMPTNPIADTYSGTVTTSIS